MTVNDIKHARIKAWIEECVKMCEPDNVVVCDGSTAEYDRLMKKCVDAGLATPLAKSLTASFSAHFRAMLRVLSHVHSFLL